MKSITKMVLAAALLGLGSSAYAGSNHACTFTTYISKQDLVNSSGKKLSTVGQVLRQDRANYHNDTGDMNDEDDYCDFDSADARARFEKAVNRSSISSNTKRAILRGNVNVWVGVSNNRVEVTVLD